MSLEYGDPITPETIEAAADRALELRRAAPDAPLEAHLERAAKDAISACVLEIEDELERGLSGTHAAVLAEVTQRLRLRLDDAHRPDDETADEASEASCPASDPPGWISRGARSGEGAEGILTHGGRQRD